MDRNGHDIQTVEVTSVDAESIQMEAWAKEVAHVLVEHYPAHLWSVGWMPGMTLCVKNMAIPGNYGYTIDGSKIATVTELKRLAMLAGGELLERCGQKRGEWNGEFFTKVEGADPRHLHGV